MNIPSNAIHICLAADNNYAMPLATTIASILYNNPEPEINIYILDGDLSPETKRNLNDLNSIRPYNLEFMHIDNEQILKLPIVTDYISAATYFRYLIPSLLPQLDRILYLDCDLIVCENLREFWETDLDGYYLAGVADIETIVHTQRLGLKDPYSYINAGVLLINLDAWRTNNIQHALFDYTVRHADELKHADQDVINVVCNGKIKIIDDKWNYLYYEYEIRPDSLKKHLYTKPIQPAIIHYIGRLKPWLKGKTKFRNVELFWYYCNMTPYKYMYAFGVKVRIWRNRIKYGTKLFFKKLFFKQ